jgi:hypothetical protein
LGEEELKKLIQKIFVEMKNRYPFKEESKIIVFLLTILIFAKVNLFFFTFAKGLTIYSSFNC